MTKKGRYKCMVIADFRNSDNNNMYSKTSLCQYDKGQHLNILGLDIGKFYNVKFITSESITFIDEAEAITDGYRVEIPDKILSEGGHYKDYYIVAYINQTDGDKAISNVKKFNILVKFVSVTETSNTIIPNYSDEELIVTDDGEGNVTIIGLTDDGDGNVVIDGNI